MNPPFFPVRGAKGQPFFEKTQSMTPQKSGLFTVALKTSLKRYYDEELEAQPTKVVMLDKIWLVIVDVAQGSTTVSVKG